MQAKLARIKLGLTQEQLRKKLKEEYLIGLSPCTIVAVEKGDYSNLKYETMIAYAKALNSTPQELFFDEE
ncbi:helix-turn-helix domain-containing protein [Clostridium chromiireducens]|uniref:Helix-turn-helix domain-containing protein n=1 Tax=Clostridium chromiireducens TaxID=225345 RepID=A0A964W3B5_9CLOT|nr:helix-turn-helix domain-containing protein [Clostridium chromiireducens]MVX64942.1 helix-turn-helix domain-containing protein [Clostridium chromiireducens]